MSTTFRDTWGLAALAAVATRRADGGVLAEVVTPLVLDEHPAMSLPFARTELAQALRRSGRATLVSWDSRLAQSGWQPLAASVALEVREDRDGDWITSGLLQQELLVHPPSRALLDTPLLRREHWWYVPRWIIRATAIERVWPVGRRQGDHTGLLAWDDADGSHAEVVAVEGWESDQLGVRSLEGADLAHAMGPAALLASDVRTPDLDHTAELRLHGHLRGRVLHVAQREGSPVLGAPPTLWRRLRQSRQLERACRRALSSGERPGR